MFTVSERSLTGGKMEFEKDFLFRTRDKAELWLRTVSWVDNRTVCLQQDWKNQTRKTKTLENSEHGSTLKSLISILDPCLTCITHNKVLKWCIMLLQRVTCWLMLSWFHIQDTDIPVSAIPSDKGMEMMTPFPVPTHSRLQDTTRAVILTKEKPSLPVPATHRTHTCWLYNARAKVPKRGARWACVPNILLT